MSKDEPKDHSDYIRRRKVHNKALRVLGKTKDKKDMTGYEDFMDQCIEDVQAVGEADNEDDAAGICQVLWEDEQDIYDF